MSAAPQRSEPFLDRPAVPERAGPPPLAQSRPVLQPRPVLRAPRNAAVLAEDIELWSRMVHDLREALRPLAELSLAGLPEGTPDDLQVLQIGGTSITLGDLRRARRLFEATA